MLCGNCNLDIPDGQRFCPNCGTQLDFKGIECDVCQGINSPTSKYCGNCGNLLQREPEKEAITTGSKELVQEERKLATVMFADVHGFTALSEHLDPEHVKSLMNDCFARLTKKIEKYGGVIDKYMGDGVMAIFGAPVSYESNEERAVIAAIEMQQTIQEFSQQTEQQINQKLSMRIGLNTGKVMAGRIGGEKNKFYTVMGDAVNLASRLEQACEIGKILISQETYEGAKKVISVKTPEPIRVKGKADPIVVHEVDKLIPNNNVQIDLDEFTAPFINRQEALALLENGLTSIQSEQTPRLIYIHGHPNIGKTRLLAETLTRHSTDYARAVFMYCQSVSYHKDNAFETLSAMLRHFFNINPNDRVENQQHQLLYGVAEYVWYHHKRLPSEISFPLTLPQTRIIFDKLLEPQKESLQISYYLAAMMGIPFTKSHLATQSYAELRQESLDSGHNRTQNRLQNLFNHIYEALLSLLNYIARVSGPIHLIVDDAFDCDIETLQMLRELISPRPKLNLGIIIISRYPFSDLYPDWEQQPDTTVHLKPFKSDQMQVFLRRLLQHSDHLPYQLVKHVIHLSDGVPGFLELFITDYQRYGVLRRGTDDAWVFDLSRLESMEIPNPIVRVVQAELDRLNIKEKIVLQKASIIGKRFWLSLLATLCRQSNLLMDEAVLDSLIARHLIHEREKSAIAEEREFLFNQNIYREVILETIPKVEREKIHADIAEWLMAKTQGQMRGFFHLLADHYKAANQYEAAYDFFIKAGHVAMREGHWQIAGENLKSALDLILANDRHDSEKLSQVYEYLGDIYCGDDRFREVSKFYHNALENTLVIEPDYRNGSHSPSTYRYVGLQRKLANIYRIRGDFARSQELIDKALAMLGEEDISAEKVEISQLLSRIFEERGNMGKAEQYAASALTMAHQLEVQKLIWNCCDHLGGLYRNKGDFAQAVKYHNFAYKGRKTANDMVGLAESVYHLGVLSIQQGNFERGVQYLKKGLSFYESLHMGHLHFSTLTRLGHAYYEYGHYKEAAECFEQGHKAMTRDNYEAHLPFYHYHMGKTRFCMGELQSSFRHFEAGIKAAEKLENIKLIIKLFIGSCSVCTELKYSGRALNIIEMAIDMSRKIGLEPLLTAALLQQAESHLQMDYQKSALNSCLKALELTEKHATHRNLTFRGLALRLLGDIYASTKKRSDESKAITCYQESIEILEKSHYPFLLARSYASYGIFMKSTQNSGLGIKYMTEASDLFSQIGARHELTRLSHFRD